MSAATAGKFRALVCAISFYSVGCAHQHIGNFTPRHRDYTPGPYADGTTPANEGSTWTTASRGLFADFRAGRVGDVVTIRIEESPNASGDANTDMRREYSASLGASGLLGLTTALQRAHPDLDPEALLALASRTDFAGSGGTVRQSTARGTIAVRVRELMPNGDLFVEGTKVILVNDEELHIYISGVIRPEDIEQNNSVASNLVADAQVEFTGRGVLSDNQQEGWLAQLLSSLSPF